jgi:DnaJ-class molecular chaperone
MLIKQHKEATMTLAQALINTELASNETRANKFLRNANELLDREATIVTCPECEGLRRHERYCDCNGVGCHWCNGDGIIFTTCQMCKGEGEVLMHKDGTIEVLV